MSPTISFKPLTKRFRVDRSAPPVLLPPAQVEKLFITAANNSKLTDHIPALAVMFGTGCRPSEAAYDNDPAWPKKQRRYQWEWARGWNENRPSEVTGGVALHLPEWADDAQTMRASKTESRMLDMPPNFFAWLKWYFEDIKVENCQQQDNYCSNTERGIKLDRMLVYSGIPTESRCGLMTRAVTALPRTPTTMLNGRKRLPVITGWTGVVTTMLLSKNTTRCR